LKAWAPLITYGTGKAAVAHLSKAVALHCGKSGYNIRCNSIHPGTFDTPILDEQLPNFDNDRGKMLEKLGTFQALGRVGQPWELAAAIVFLASDDSAFITATEFVVDGGFKEL
jgi:3(or 17)beta-hydroxysteroid dehydrogenase